MERKSYHCGFAYQIFERNPQDRDTDNGSPHWLQEEEFLQKYQIHHEIFHQLLSMIKDHPIFQSNSNKPQAPVSHQLLLFLHHLGKRSSGALCNMFQVGCGTLDNFKCQFRKAICSLRNNMMVWSDNKRTKRIGKVHPIQI
jgi:hypothetical protein